ncbi:MAG: EamA family transporter [Ginsengibacter sp.]
MKNNKQLLGYIYAISAAIIWGVSGNFGQFLFQERAMSIEWLVVIRLLISGVLLLAFSAAQKKNDFWLIWKNKKDLFHLILFAFLGIVAVQYTYFAAIKHSNAATATVLQYVGPVLIAVYLAIVNKKLPNPKQSLAIFLAIAGTFLLVTHGSVKTLSISTAGLVWGLLSACALAYYTVKPVRLLNKYPSALVIGWGMTIGGIGFSFVHAPWKVSGVWDSYTWAFTVFIIVLGSLISFYIYLSAVKMIGAQTTSLLASAEPLSATVMAVFWLNVPFVFMDWLGTICIVITILLLARGDRKGVWKIPGVLRPGIKS